MAAPRSKGRGSVAVSHLASGGVVSRSRPGVRARVVRLCFAWRFAGRLIPALPRVLWRGHFYTAVRVVEVICVHVEVPSVHFVLHSPPSSRRPSSARARSPSVGVSWRELAWSWRGAGVGLAWGWRGATVECQEMLRDATRRHDTSRCGTNRRGVARGGTRWHDVARRGVKRYRRYEKRSARGKRVACICACCLFYSVQRVTCEPPQHALRNTHPALRSAQCAARVPARESVSFCAYKQNACRV